MAAFKRSRPRRNQINKSVRNTRQTSQRGKASTQSRFSGGLRAWTRRHAYSFFSSLGSLVRSPLGTLMTVIVLGIALALPLGLWVGLNNLKQVSPATDQLSTLSVFLQTGSTDKQTRKLAENIETWQDVVAVNILSPEDALADFRENSGFAAAVDALTENPLPWVLEVRLKPLPEAQGEVAANQQLDTVLQRLQSLAGVDFAQYDLKWLERLQALMGLGAMIARILAVLFAFAVIFVVGNTIRLDIQNRREEIEVMSLVGATEAFIRRPFLYTGFWYGLLGGLVAVSLVALALALIQSPLQRLLLSYQSEFELITVGFYGGLMVLVIGGGLGLLGAALAVRRHLNNLNPR